MSSNIVPGPQIADERERERVRLAQPLAISDDIIAVGRTFKVSKQRCEWHVCFGPYGREHVVEVTVSKRSGKREVIGFPLELLLQHKWQRPGGAASTRPSLLCSTSVAQ